MPEMSADEANIIVETIKGKEKPSYFFNGKPVKMKDGKMYPK